VSNRNLTVSLPVELIRRAKVYAAEHDTTINAYIRELLQEALIRKEERRAALKRILEISEKGPASNVDPHSFRREDLYERG
jgi:plasmid stability protein